VFRMDAYSDRANSAHAYERALGRPDGWQQEAAQVWRSSPQSIRHAAQVFLAAEHRSVLTVQ
ncbi:MAG TPA: hypothetical protein VGF45_04195, partial [Polyangia bacterium]